MCWFLLEWWSGAYHFGSLLPWHWLLASFLGFSCLEHISYITANFPRMCLYARPIPLGAFVMWLWHFLFFVFFSPQLILQKSNGQFQRNLSIFQGSRGGPTFSRVGSNFFQEGSNCLFPIETHNTCDFPGGIRTPCSFPPPPPSESALV